MKKTLTALAVMAIAAAAYADITGTWASWGTDGVASGTKNGEYTYYGGQTSVGVTDLAVYHSSKQNNTASQNDIFNINNMPATTSDPVDGGLYFGFSIEEGFQLTGATMVGEARVSQAGPDNLDWYVSSSTNAPSGSVLDSITFTAGGSAQANLPVDSSLGNLSGSGGVFLIGNGPRASGATTSPTGNFAFQTSTVSDLHLQGTLSETSAVPEPATMSLLGLGALAMALRRKLRK